MRISIMAGDAIYMDTSGLLAVLDGGDECHSKAAAVWVELLATAAPMVMTEYVQLECWSLIQRRLGLAAAGDFYRDVLPLCEVRPVGERGFDVVARQVMLMNRRDVSLVDVSSFDCMRREGLRLAFAFDQHFEQQGFVTPENKAWPRRPDI